MPNSDMEVQECDARKEEQKEKAGLQKAMLTAIQAWKNE